MSRAGPACRPGHAQADCSESAEPEHSAMATAARRTEQGGERQHHRRKRVKGQPGHHACTCAPAYAGQLERRGPAGTAWPDVGRLAGRVGSVRAAAAAVAAHLTAASPYQAALVTHALGLDPSGGGARARAALAPEGERLLPRHARSAAQCLVIALGQPERRHGCCAGEAEYCVWGAEVVAGGGGTRIDRRQLLP